MSEPQGPLRSAWSAAVLLLGTCLLLVLCVHLIESIWPWLVGGVILIAFIIALTAWLRWRRRW